MKTLEERFFSKINKIENGCWEWNGAKNEQGYGKLGIDYKVYSAHRVSYELHYKKIPNNVFVCHKCDNPSCCNPKHLFLGTHKQNMFDRNSKNRQLKGIQMPLAKLSEEDVIEIKNLLLSGMKQKDIAQKYNIHSSIISEIKNNKTWKHI